MVSSGSKHSIASASSSIDSGCHDTVLTPYSDLVIISSSDKKVSERVEGNTSYRTWRARIIAETASQYESVCVTLYLCAKGSNWHALTVMLVEAAHERAHLVVP